MTRTLERCIDNGTGGRFALTLMLSDQEAKRIGAEDSVIASVLAQANDMIQRVLYPNTHAPSARPHPRDTALFERLSDGSLVRIYCLAEDVKAIEPTHRYLIGAYDDRGRLLPTFWSLPLINLRELMQTGGM